MTTLDLDKLAIEQAELKLHALFGKHLMGELAAKWEKQGVADYEAGVPLAEVLPEHRAGWKARAAIAKALEEQRQQDWSNGYWAAREGKPESGNTSAYREGWSTGRIVNRRLQETAR